jgi:iron-sulfur cluster repair protein YtfE (RIC family)
MTEDANWLYHDHLDLEHLPNDCATSAKAEQWADAARLFGRLLDRLKGHMRLEEEVLFPAYEQLPGAPKEPTRSLRNDHDAMVRWCRDLHFSVQSQDSPAFLGAIESLRELLVWHDEKEEQLFLPMAGHSLFERREAVMERLRGLDWKDRAGTVRHWDF